MSVRIEYMDIDDLKESSRNPKLHAIEDIKTSITHHGFVEPIIINEKTGQIVAGHGRLDALKQLKQSGKPTPTNIQVSGDSWQVPVIRGNTFNSDAEAESYLLTVNKLVEKGGWNKHLLNEMLQTLEPIGFEVLREINQDIDSAIESTQASIPQPTNPFGLTPTKQPGVAGVGKAKVDSTGLKSDAKYRCSFDEIPGNLKGVFSIDEYQIFTSSNSLGVPDLLPEMILPEIPKPIQTWGGITDTPDDGKSYYFYVFGSTASKGVPYERAIVAHFCHDTHVNTFLNTPGYRVGKMLQARVVGAVVPDVSLWEGNPLVLHMYAIYQAQWLGRFMQEAGIKVIPRFEYFLPETREFSLCGIPKSPSTLATQLHTGFSDEHIPRIKESLLTGLKLLNPGQFLVYVSERGANILEDIGKDLPVQELIMLPTAKKVRRTEDRAEVDPYLRELRKRKRGWEGKPNAYETDESEQP